MNIWHQSPPNSLAPEAFAFTSRQLPRSRKRPWLTARLLAFYTPFRMFSVQLDCCTFKTGFLLYSKSSTVNIKKKKNVPFLKPYFRQASHQPDRTYLHLENKRRKTRGKNMYTYNTAWKSQHHGRTKNLLCNQSEKILCCQDKSL